MKLKNKTLKEAGVKLVKIVVSDAGINNTYYEVESLCCGKILRMQGRSIYSRAAKARKKGRRITCIECGRKAKAGVERMARIRVGGFGGVSASDSFEPISLIVRNALTDMNEQTRSERARLIARLTENRAGRPDHGVAY